MCLSTVWSDDSMIENSGRSPSTFKTADARASITPKAAITALRPIRLRSTLVMSTKSR